jgi:ferredoxin-NADP reductase
MRGELEPKLNRARHSASNAEPNRRCKLPGPVAGGRYGQHVDVRLTADDGYQTERSYSIASAPECSELALTAERIDDREVSPYLTQELRAGDELDLGDRP